MKYQTYISKKWSLEQKKAAHLWLKKKWNQADTARMKEKSLVWIIKKCDDLSQEEKLIGEILVFGQPVEQWGEKLLDKKIEQIIDWFYIHVIKKKIEQTFGYQESKKAKSDDWWENIQETVTSFGTKKMMEPIFPRCNLGIKGSAASALFEIEKTGISYHPSSFFKRKTIFDHSRTGNLTCVRGGLSSDVKSYFIWNDMERAISDEYGSRAVCSYGIKPDFRSVSKGLFAYVKNGFPYRSRKELS